MKALRTQHLFDGHALRGAATLLIEDGRILGVLGVGEAPCPVETLPEGSLLAPGFVDLQVNGGGGVMFNDGFDAATIAAAHARCGTTTILPTLISGSRDAIAQALQGGRVHVEGPFIAPARRGIHPAANILALAEDDMVLLADAALVTLAPEHVPDAAIGRLAAAGVRVFAGHTDATAARIGESLRAGVVGFTHLFNAMSQFGSRAPGAVGAALADRACYAGIIADGLHVDPVAIAAAFAAMGAGRLFLVSDAMATAGSPIAAFSLYGTTISLRNGRLTDAGGTLAGAHLTMAEAVRNVVAQAGIGLADALRMATATPAACMGWADRGRIAPGLRADLVCLDAELRVSRTWVAGATVPPG